MQQAITTTTDPITVAGPRPPTLGHDIVQITNHPTNHESFGIGLFHNPGSKKVGILNREGYGHSLFQGGDSKLLFRTTSDGGLTCTDPVTVYVEPSTAYSGLAFATTPSGKWVAITTRIKAFGSEFRRVEPVCLTSTNEGATWTAAIIPNVSGVSFHSQLTPYKGDGFGNEASWICYGFRTEPGSAPDLYNLWYLLTTDNGATWTAGEIQDRAPDGLKSSEFTVANVGVPGDPNRWVMVGRNDTSENVGSALLWKSTDLIHWDGPIATGQPTGAAMSNLIAHDDHLWWYNPVRHIHYGNRPRDTWQIQDASFEAVWADPAGCWPGFRHLTNTTPGLIGYAKHAWVDGALYIAYGSDETEDTLVGANVYLMRPDMPNADRYGGLLNLLRSDGDVLVRVGDTLVALAAGATGTVLTRDDALPALMGWKVASGGEGGGGGAVEVASVVPAVPSSTRVNNSAQKTELCTFGLPGGLAQEGGRLVIRIAGVMFTAVARTHNLRVEIAGGATIVQGAITAAALASPRGWEMEVTILLGVSTHRAWAKYTHVNGAATSWSATAAAVRAQARPADFALNLGTGGTFSVSTQLQEAVDGFYDELHAASLEYVPPRA